MKKENNKKTIGDISVEIGRRRAAREIAAEIGADLEELQRKTEVFVEVYTGKRINFDDRGSEDD